MNYYDECVGKHVFKFRFPGPGPISIVGDFNNWEPGCDEMTPDGGGWRIALYLPEGRYRYGFAVRGCIFRDMDPQAEETREGWPWSLVESASERFVGPDWAKDRDIRISATTIRNPSLGVTELCGVG